MRSYLGEIEAWMSLLKYIDIFNYDCIKDNSNEEMFTRILLLFQSVK